MPAPPESLAIAELTIYPPLLLLTLVVIARHGIHRHSGWIYLSLFCAVRVVGAALGIVAAAGGPGAVRDGEWSAVLGSVGISPLLLASLGLLKRVTDEATSRVPPVEGTRRERSWFETVMSYTVLGRMFGRLGVHQFATSHRSRVLQLLQLPAATALIICIVGGSDLTDASPSDRSTGAKLIKAGLIIFLLIYACLFLLVAATSARDRAALPACEQRVLLALTVALPLLGVRILFSLLAYFSSLAAFSPTDGNVLVRAFMAVLEEVLVVVAYAVAGILVPTDRDAGMGDVEIVGRRPKTGASRPVEYAPQQRARGVLRDGA